MNGPDIESESRRLLDEHAELKSLLDEIRWTLFEQQADPPIIAGLLRQFSAHVLTHFGHEEQGGYFSEVVLIAPRLNAKVQSLLAQHTLFREQLSGMCQHVEQGDSSDEWYAELRSKFEHFTERFLRHEHAEDHLVQEAYDRDIGAED